MTTVTNKYRINGQDVFNVYGLVFQKGTQEELLRLARRKEGYAYEWPDEDGTERDDTDPVFESKEVNIRAIMVGSNKADFLAKYNALKTFLMGSGYFDFDSIVLNKRFKLLYQDMSSYELLNPIRDNEQIVARVSFIFFDDFPTSNFTIA